IYVTVEIVFQSFMFYLFFFQAEDGIRDRNVTGVQTCALPISKFRSCISRSTGFFLNMRLRTMIVPIPRMIYKPANSMSIRSTCPLEVAASDVFNNPLNTHGCLPTSAIHQPASIAISDSGPPKTINQRNHRLSTIGHLRFVPNQYISDKKIIHMPIVTIMSNK